MKKLALILVLCGDPALAQSPTPPTVEQITEQSNAIITAVRAQRDAANDQAAQLAAQLTLAQKRIADLEKAAAPKEPSK